MSGPILIKRVTIAPFDCLSEGWGRIRDQYWLFAGITVVGILLGSALPMGILLGPLMCGIYGCYIDKWQGRPARFEGLFKGFESGLFEQSLIATLVMAAVGMAVVLPLMVVAVAGGLLMGLASQSRHGPSLPGLVVASLIVGASLLCMILTMAIGTLFVFTYPLIVDRRMSGLEAIKLSVRAAWANVWGVLGLMLTTTILGMGGMLCCYVGAFLVMPVSFGAFMAAYVKAFGLSERPVEAPRP